MSKARDIDIEVMIGNPVEKVYNAWIKPDLLERWLTCKAVVEPAVGGAYELYWEPEHPERNSTVGCRITDMVLNRELSFSWRGPEDYRELMGDQTHVFLRFEKQEGGTRLRFIHTGWGSGDKWEEARRWQADAWQEALENLKNMLENTSKIIEHISMN